ncbi:uncharacterized protein LOC124530348 isoform X1 [Vanessa cardui]|uniref:uncharacterized protein LOC124530348 isoform X1 n=1 Tax=Vanessa cardui TaxID=171605 RepID=UPI001F1402C3|nr:uncharacterized protein LOC124530348 isoform X1 [Vanessa cardui]
MEQRILPVTTISEPLRYREDTGLRVQPNSPSLTKAQILEINNRRTNTENDVLKKQNVRSEYFGTPIGEINKETFRPGTYTKQIVPSEFSKPPIGRINRPPIKSNDEITLELQGMSPEYIQSVGKQIYRSQNEQNPSLINHSYQNILGNLKYPKPTSQTIEQPNQYPTASFQNPSAETLYKLKQALPYRINTQQFSNTPQDNTFLKNIINNSRRIQDIYKSEQTIKRYTVIHPDGRIEHVDQIDGILEKYPNHVMVKSDDVMKHVQGRPIAFAKPQTQVTQNPTIKPNTINNLQSNVGQNAANNTISDTKTSITVPVVTNPILIKERQLPKLSETHFETVINKKGDKTSDLSTIQKSKTSPPVHKIISNSNLNETEESPKSVNTPEAIEKAVEHTQQNQIRNNTELKNISGIEDQNVIGHNVLLNSSTADEPVNKAENSTEILMDPTPTPIVNESHTLTSVQEPEMNRSEASHLEINKESDNLVSSPTSTPTPNTENTTENPKFWFKADDDFWKKLMSGNNGQNLIYFLFVPPKPNPEKETKTTIYPNGTTVEEVIERINGDDGEPKIKKSTIITHKNNTDVNSYK